MLAVLGLLVVATACGTTPNSGQGPTGDPDAPPIDCGQVTGPAGKLDLISPPTSAGTAACPEALSVLRDYYRDAPAKAQGTARRLVVDGWTCEADADSRNAGQVGCDKNGLAFLTQGTKI
jgi:hypothetical protein